MNTSNLPLSGVKVLEMGTLIAGPFSTRILAEFGAEVIKVELPKSGDPLRKWRVMHNGTSLWWYVQSRNKKCITVDVRTEEGLEVIKSLLKECDVFVENFRPGTIAKWGLTPEILEELNPNLIVSHISGFGQTGPYSDRAGFGSVGEAMGGLRYLTGYPDLPPVRVGVSIGDSIASLYSVIGILMALYHRDVKNGGGQEIDVALYEAIFSLMESLVPEYDKKGVIRERTGSIFPGIVPTNVYKTKDEKYVVLAANGDKIFQRLLKVLGRDELVGDERFLTNDLRVQHQEMIESMIAEWVGQKILKECLDIFNENAIPAGTIYNAEDIVNDPHYQARDMILEMEHEDIGKMKVPGIVPKLSKTPGQINWLGPKIGEHNVEVLKEIGISDAMIEEMSNKGVI
ncbi:CaiB/BaiF CoA-transferase family protein [Bacillus sp. JJ1566]|uniref:CaiB/BaiF CoA transferase family protein n=1 Tax=Bacillus sp. JJ1566 TaxID=3122961 RepID=UPI002FFD77E5